MTEITWIDLPTLLSDIVANFVANICAGALFALLGASLALWVSRDLKLFERAREAKELREREIRRAIRLLELLNEEVPSLLEKIPKWRENLSGLRWGKVFIILTPAWDAAQRSGELAKVVQAELLQGLVEFYDGLDCTRRWLPLVAQSWLVSEEHVESLEGKRTALIAMAVGGLAQAHHVGHTLMWRIESEITRLRNSLAEPAKTPAVAKPARGTPKPGQGPAR